MKIAHRPLNGMSGHDAGRMLLRQLYREETGQELPQILRTESGKPYFPHCPLHFSISHTKNHAFCVLSEKNVGIDAEETDRTFSEKLAEKVLSPVEKAQYDAAADKQTAFLTFWVLKEAEAKLTGEGLRIYPNHTNFSLDHPGVTIIDGCIVAVLEGE